MCMRVCLVVRGCEMVRQISRQGAWSAGYCLRIVPAPRQGGIGLTTQTSADLHPILRGFNSCLELKL